MIKWIWQLISGAQYKHNQINITSKKMLTGYK
jgi:hypothetical protein